MRERERERVRERGGGREGGRERGRGERGQGGGGCFKVKKQSSSCLPEHSTVENS